MKPLLKTGWPYDAVPCRPVLTRELEAAAPESSEADGQLLALTQKLTAQVAAQDAAIRVLLAASPHLGEVASQFLDTMDAVADVVDAEAIDSFRTAYQSLHATMLLELKKRAARAPKEH